MTARKPFYGWFLLAVLWAVYLTSTFTVYGGSVANSYMIGSISMSRSTLGLGFTLFQLSQGLPAALIALALNRGGLRVTLALGCSAVAAGAALMAFVVRNGWQYVVAYGLIVGAGFGFCGVLPVQTGVTRWFERKRTLAMSLVLTAGGVGGLVVAPTLNKLIAATGGNWRTGWYFIGGASVIATVITLGFVKDRPSDIGQAPDGAPVSSATAASMTGATPPSASRVHQATADFTASQARRTAALWLIVAGGAGFAGPYNLAMAHGVVHLRGLGIAAPTAAMSVALIASASIMGRLAAGFLGDRIEPRLIWAAALALMVAGCVAVIGAAGLEQMAVYSVLVGLAFGASMVCWPTALSNFFGPGDFASINGLTLPIITVFGALAPLAGGMVYDALGSYTLAFVGGAVLAGLGAVGLLLARPPRVC